MRVKKGFGEFNLEFLINKYLCISIRDGIMEKGDDDERKEVGGKVGEWNGSRKFSCEIRIVMDVKLLSVIPTRIRLHRLDTLRLIPRRIIVLDSNASSGFYPSYHTCCI